MAGVEFRPIQSGLCYCRTDIGGVLMFCHLLVRLRACYPAGRDAIDADVGAKALAMAWVSMWRAALEAQ